MSEDMQKLHDAVLQLGDAALEIATALSAFMGSGAAPPWPNTGEPLTVDRFHKLMSVDEPTIAGTGTGFVEVPAARSFSTLSYVSDKPLGSEARRHKRVRAWANASKSGYDFEHWCRMFRRVRLTEFKVSITGMAIIMDMTEGAIQNWETGVCFALPATRSRIERLCKELHGISESSWRQPA